MMHCLQRLGSSGELHVPVRSVIMGVNNPMLTTTLHPHNHSVFHFQYSIKHVT